MDGAAGFSCNQITVNRARYGAAPLSLVTTCRDAEEASCLNQAIQQNILSCCDLYGAGTLELCESGRCFFILRALGKGSLNGHMVRSSDSDNAAAAGGGDLAAQVDILTGNDFNPIRRPDRFRRDHSVVVQNRFIFIDALGGIDGLLFVHRHRLPFGDLLFFNHLHLGLDQLVARSEVGDILGLADPLIVKLQPTVCDVRPRGFPVVLVIILVFVDIIPAARIDPVPAPTFHVIRQEIERPAGIGHPSFELHLVINIIPVVDAPVRPELGFISIQIAVDNGAGGAAVCKGRIQSVPEIEVCTTVPAGVIAV